MQDLAGTRIAMTNLNQRLECNLGGDAAAAGWEVSDVDLVRGMIGLPETADGTRNRCEHWRQLWRGTAESWPA